MGWLVNVGQQVKYGGLARTVRAYKAGYLGAAQHYTEILNGVQTAEVYPKAVYLKYGFEERSLSGIIEWLGTGTILSITCHLPFLFCPCPS